MLSILLFIFIFIPQKVLTISTCSLHSTDITCSHFSNYDAFSSSLRRIQSEQIQNNHAVFRRLHLFNCSFKYLPENAFLGLKFSTIFLENVSIKKVISKDFFGSSSGYLKRLIYRNKDFTQSSTQYDNNLFESLRKCRYLQHVELCMTNLENVIPSGAFNHNYLRSIRFTGNYSSLSIQSQAFNSLKRIQSVVFNKLTVVNVAQNALDVEPIQSGHVSFIFNRCKWPYELKKSFDLQFRQSLSPVKIYFYSNDLISVSSISFFEPFFRLSTENVLFITKLDCGSMIDASNEFFFLKKMIKMYKNHLILRCAQDKHFWKLLLEDEKPNVQAYNSSTTENVTEHESILTMYSILLQNFHLPSHHFVEPVLKMPKSVKSRWFTDLSLLFDWYHVPLTLLLQMLDQSAVVVLEELNASIESYQIEPSKNLHCSVFKVKENRSDTLTSVSHSGDQVQLLKQQSSKSSELYLVSTWAQQTFDEKIGNATSSLILNTNLISVNLIRLANKTKIHNATVKIRFHNLTPRHLFDVVHCVYWDFSTAQWSTFGCQYMSSESSPSTAVCVCSHLSNFAALLDVSGREENTAIKSLLTYIFCGASVLCLVVSIGLSLRLGRIESYNLANDQFRRRANKATLNRHIAICLLLTHAVILVGMDRKEVQSVCLTFSLTLSFFLLASFSFMLLQGYHLLKSTSHPLVSDLRQGNYAVFGYGAPASILAIAVMTIWSRDLSLADVFIGDYFCWISTKNNPLHIFIIIVPISLSISINIIFFIFILKTIIRRNRFLAHFSQSFSISHHPQSAKQSLSLLLLVLNFGICWLVFMLYITETGQYFAYIFIILNGSQGVFFLLNQILFLQSKKVSLFKKNSFSPPNSRICSIATQTSIT